MIRVRPKHCAIVPIDEPDVTPGGIIIPEQAKDRTKQGIVKYVGPNCEFVQPLDYVLYGAYNGQLLHLDGEGRLIVVSEEFISARVSHDDIDSLEIAGVYYRGRDEDYIPATYETVIEFITRAITNSPIMLNRQRWFAREVTDKSKQQHQHRVMADSR